MKSCPNFWLQTTRSTLLDPNLMFHCDSYCLDAFGTVCCATTLSSKWAKLVQKFMPWSRVRIFDYKPLDPPHWTLTSCFVAFRTIWMHLGQFVALQHSVQNGPNWCKSSCHEVASEFFRTNAPDPPPLDSKLMFWCVWYYLDAFGTVWLSYKTQCKTGWTGAKVRATKWRLKFSQQTHPIGPVGT